MVINNEKLETIEKLETTMSDKILLMREMREKVVLDLTLVGILARPDSSAEGSEYSE